MLLSLLGGLPMPAPPAVVGNSSASGGFLAPASVAPNSLPPQDNALDAILQSLIVGVTGLPGNLVRPRWQPHPPPMPEPTVDWCAISVTDTDREPNISLVHTSDGVGYSTSYEVTVLTVLASFYGPSANGLCDKLRVGLMIAQNREPLYATGLALMEMPGKTTFLPEYVNNQALRRADIQILFRRRSAEVWQIENIVQMQGEIVSDRAGGGLADPLQTPTSLDPFVE